MPASRAFAFLRRKTCASPSLRHRRRLQAPGGWTLKEDLSVEDLLDRFYANVSVDTAAAGGRRSAAAAAKTLAGVRREAGSKRAAFPKPRFAIAVKKGL